MGNELREELRELCRQVKTIRTPAIRRSLQDRYLYATDLPQAAEEAAVKEFMRKAREAGWKVSEAEGWLQLDKPVHMPPKGWYEGPAGAEAAGCLSILRRHAGRTAPSDGSAERRLIKAAETGAAAFKEACRLIHAQWAKGLREGNKIPDVNPEFFGGSI